MAELQGIFACFDLGRLFGIGIKFDYPGPFDQPATALFFGKPVSPPFFGVTVFCHCLRRESNVLAKLPGRHDFVFYYTPF
jgi:hypothetical protein